MNIYPIDSNNNISMYGKGNNSGWFKRLKQKLLDTSPLHTSKDEGKKIENWNKTSHWVGDPMWNRGIMGATALVTQPAIDYYNHRVDDETRTVARNRTVAKIVAGTLVGMFVVRGPVSKAVEKMTDVKGEKKWSKLLLPQKYIKRMTKDQNGLKNYRSALSMAIALAAMCFTNFLLDAKLTILFTNYLNKKSNVMTNREEDEVKKTEKAERKEGFNA